MKAVDTNVLVRLIVQDDPDQANKALDLIADGVSVSLTILLELGWVLQSRYRFDRTLLARTLRKLLSNPCLHISFADQVSIAVDLYENGADFADTIHLVAARGADAFVTFDRTMADGDRLGIVVERIR